MNFGWQKDKFDCRDFLYKATHKAIPEEVILTDYFPEVRDQGNVGSCVGFGIGANLVARAKRLGVYSEWFSPTWIYNGARFLEGTLAFDAGSRPRDALHWLYMKGCLLEHLWPYNPDKLDTTAPPSHLEPEAAKNPLLSYFRIVDGVAGICEIVAGEYGVSVGCPWFEKWRNPGKDGILAEVNTGDAVAGGHETCILGYSNSKGFVYGINSWSKDWGANGFYKMPFQAFDVFKQLGGYDAHYIGLTAAPEEAESTCQFSQSIVKGLNWAWEKAGKKSRFPKAIVRG